MIAGATDLRIRQIAVSDFMHSLISCMRARIPPPPARMGETWNDPQLRGRVNCGDYEVDFGSVIPAALMVADLPELAALIAPRRLLFAHARDMTTPDASRLTARFQRITKGASSYLQYVPNSAMNSQLLLNWLQNE